MSEIATPARYREGLPVYRYRTAPETPPVWVQRVVRHTRFGHGHRHIHDFPVLMYVERAVNDRTALSFDDGDACVLSPGEVVDPAMVASIAAGRMLAFDPVIFGSDDASWPSWRTHPLLFPFVHGLPGGLLRLNVPEARRPAWGATITAIERELGDRAEGYRAAVLAHLTLLLVDVARLATDVVDDLRRSHEPLLAEVFEVIEGRYGESLSLRDVADTVGVTPGHLTTLVRQRTGRTVGTWITERRMVEARRLLAESDLPISEVARRTGLSDPGYFARVFRRANGVTPREWRKSAGAEQSSAPGAESGS